MTKTEFKEARTKLKMTQQQFAIALGYASFVSISRKEIGKVIVTRMDEIIINSLLPGVASKPKRHAK